VCTLNGGTGTVALEHVTRRPAGPVASGRLFATISKPGVSEAVPELVRVQLGNGSDTTTTAQHLCDAPLRQLLAAAVEPGIIES
jgi:hypothetical protein